MRLEYFEMLDTVSTLDLERRCITCTSTIPLESPVFDGHFPGYALVPGVLLIETMAQAAGFLSLVLLKFEKMPFLASVKEAKLRSFLKPGEIIEVSATLAHEGSGFTVANADIRAGGKRVCEAEIMLRILPFPSSEFSAMMRQRAVGLGLEMDT